MRKMLVLAFVLALFVPSLAAAQGIPIGSGDPNTQLAFDYNPADIGNVQGFALCVDRTEQEPEVSSCVDLGALVPAVTTSTNLEFRIAFPALTPGTHTLRVMAYNPAGRALSNTVSVTVFVLPPSPPKNLRIVRGTGGGQ